MIKLNFGCGPFHLDGWTNIDYYDGWEPKPDIHFNVLSTEPKDNNYEQYWNNGEVDFIYSSHLLSLFDDSAILRVLKKWYELLKPGGVVRIVEPDLTWFLNQYLTGGNAKEHTVLFNSTYSNKRDLDDVRRSGKIFYSAAHQFQFDYHRYGHKFLFDSDTLFSFLYSIGFKPGRVIRYNRNESSFDCLSNIDRKRNSGGELFIEGIK